MTPRRLATWAAVATVVLLVAGAVTQLRPFWWDTRRPEHSIEVFGQHRALLMGGAWARILLLFPMTALGVAVAGLVDADTLEARIGKAFATAAGVLSVVSGAMAVVIGVAAEEEVPTRAVAVLADSVYWVQDNLLTLSLLAFAVALAAFSTPLREAGELPAWGRRAGQASIVAVSAVPLSFYIGGAEHASALYAVPAFSTQAAMVLWLLALARGGRRMAE